MICVTGSLPGKPRLGTRLSLEYINSRFSTGVSHLESSVDFSRSFTVLLVEVISVFSVSYSHYRYGRFTADG